MYFVIFARDNENVLDKRLAVRPAHLERLKQLNDQGRLLVAGPMPKTEDKPATETGFAGSCLIAEFASLEEAKQWASQDPYVEAGVYGEVTVLPYLVVYPKQD